MDQIAEEDKLEIRYNNMHAADVVDELEVARKGVLKASKAMVEEMMLDSLWQESNFWRHWKH